MAPSRGGRAPLPARRRVAAWYASYDAVPLADKPLTLVMALATFEADLKAGGHL
jgi:hypothetical protein